MSATPAQGTPAAEAAVREALGRAGLAAAEPRLLRHGTNAVFALGDLVARVAERASAAAAQAAPALDVARWLEAVGFPAVRAVADAHLAAPQPITLTGHVVTFWYSLGEPARHGTTADLGALLRRFHALELPPSLRPAPLDPVGRVERQLAGARAVLPDGDRAVLAGRLADVAARYRALDLTLPPGHVHGDATVANVVLDRAGRPTLIDLDLVRVGAREWDLLRTAVYARRLGWHTEGQYRAFAEAYGVDVAALPGFDVLADLCLLLQVAWLADAATRRAELLPELAARVAWLRAPGPGQTWRAV